MLVSCLCSAESSASQKRLDPLPTFICARKWSKVLKSKRSPCGSIDETENDGCEEEDPRICVHAQEK